MGPWLRREDSNLQSPDPESGGLPISRLLNGPAATKLKELHRRVKALNIAQRSLEPPQRALLAEHGDDIMYAWTHGAARQGHAHRLGEVPPRYLFRLPRFGGFV